MMRGLCIVFTWTFLVILCEPECELTDSCLHDIIQGGQKNAVSGEDSHRKIKRQVKENSLKNLNRIRIQPVYFLSQFLQEKEKLALQNVLLRAISKIESVLSVIHKVQGPLLLKRKDACPIVLKNGINKGKCSRIQKGYKGEFCLDRFKIPADHLEGFAIYNKTNPDPIKVYETDGPGLEDTDFVLYVTSLTTALCNPYKTSALAYAAACQLDDYGRPIGGQVNFCPRILKTQKFHEELLYKTAIHELFHALGFSSKLFEKFVSCDKDGKCSPREQPVVQTINGTSRLITPAVVREMKHHFGCDTEAKFGGPLETVDGKHSSHWDPLLMHSSIMTAKEQKPYLTLIDRITLAVFEDSGWYKVNYSLADPFIWGKGKGCQFGTQKTCMEEDGFCSVNSTGCHHLRLTKAKCTANPKLQPSVCGVFAADQKPCFAETSLSTSTEDEAFSSNSRCFMSSLVPMQNPQISQISDPITMTGRCYETKCAANNVYVRVQNGDWILCQAGSRLQVKNFEGFIQCPSYLEMCTSFHLKDLPGAFEASSAQLINDDPDSDSDKESKRRRLYADIKISTPLNNSQSDRLQKAFVRDVLVKNKILVSQVSSTSYHDSFRFCFHLMLEDDNTLKRFAIRDLFVKAVTKTFNGHYDDQTTVNVLTSSAYFCKSYSGRQPWYLQGGGANSLYPFFTGPFVGLLWLLINLILYLRNVF